jgi:hypothetical protein
VPRWGINGAATASVIAYLISIAMTIVLGRRYFMLPFPWRSAAQVGLATAAMTLALFPFRARVSASALSSQIAGGALVYALVLFACDFFAIRRAILRRFSSIPSVSASMVEAT